jgi:hypothetical protein
MHIETYYNKYAALEYQHMKGFFDFDGQERGVL